MLPSDHFVRMYNEMFKMLLEKGESSLENYWHVISRLQETIVDPYIDKAGLAGMYEYWEHIHIEENCDATLTLTDDYFEFRMNACPSLGKVLNNDALPCRMYCDHCAGWIEPIMKKKGYYLVYDIISREKPQCNMRVYKDRDKARKYAGEVALLAKPCDWLLET